jgi:hypothetical protein
MQHFPNVITALAQCVKPAPHNATKKTLMIIKPSGHGWMPLCCITELKQRSHRKPTIAAERQAHLPGGRGEL